VLVVRGLVAVVVITPSALETDVPLTAVLTAFVLPPLVAVALTANVVPAADVAVAAAMVIDDEVVVVDKSAVVEMKVSLTLVVTPVVPSQPLTSRWCRRRPSHS
jgi:hypothetical protein